MVLLRGLLIVLKVGVAVGCILLGFLLFPTWYDVCKVVSDLILSIAPGLDTAMVMFLNIFPYLSIFLICLGLYIAFVRAMDKIAGSSDDSGGL